MNLFSGRCVYGRSKPADAAAGIFPVYQPFGGGAGKHFFCLQQKFPGQSQIPCLQGALDTAYGTAY